MPRVTIAQAELPTKPHALYRFYDRTDVLLYVGISLDLPARLRKHRREKPWWLEIAHITIEPQSARADALAAEAAAIKAEKPLYNDQHNPTVCAPEAAAGGHHPDRAHTGAGDLGALIMDQLTQFERDLVSERTAALPDDERIFDDPAAEAGRIAAGFLDDTRGQLDAAVFALLKALPDEFAERFTAEARRLVEMYMGDDYTDYDITANTVYQLADHIAAHGFASSPAGVS